MKFLIFASLCVASVLAAPEAESFVTGTFTNTYNGYNRGYPYNTGYPGYPAYTQPINRISTPAVRTSYAVGTPYPGYPFTNFYSGYPFYNNYQVRTPFVRRVQREAEAEPEADSEAKSQFYFNTHRPFYAKTYSGFPGYPYYNNAGFRTHFNGQIRTPAFNGQFRTPEFNGQFRTPEFNGQFRTPEFNGQFRTPASSQQLMKTQYNNGYPFAFVYNTALSNSNMYQTAGFTQYPVVSQQMASQISPVQDARFVQQQNSRVVQQQDRIVEV